MKINIRIISVFALLFSFSISFGRMIDLANDFLKASTDYDNGRFTLSTLEGDPATTADNNKSLLYKKTPLTSITTVYIDGETPIFGSDAGTMRKRSVVEGKKLVTEWSYKDIFVSQEIILTHGQSSADDQMVMAYRLSNKGGRKIKVGLRILLDTVLGDQKPRNFGIPGQGNIEKEMQLYRDSIPSFWYCLDNPDSPVVKAQATMTGQGLTRPDRVLFAAWDRLYDNVWDFTIDSTKDFKRQGTAEYDSAAALYYDPIDLDKDKSIYFATSYGVYIPIVFSDKDFKTTLSIPDQPKSPPIPVSYEFMNQSKFQLDKLTFELTVPHGFSLSNIETNLIEYTRVGTNESRKALWNLLSGSIGGKFPVHIKASAYIGTNIQTTDIEKTFSINYKENKDVTIIQSGPIVTNTNNAPVPVTNTTPVITSLTAPVFVQPVVMSEQEKTLIEDIKQLDVELENLNKRYDIMAAIYKNIYLTNSIMLQDLDVQMNAYEDILSNEEKSLTNLKNMLKE